MSAASVSRLDGTVLVTGGAGFLGRAVVATLRAQGACQVRVLALPQEAIPTGWAGQVEVVRGDITCLADVERALRGCRHVFHLAALVGDAGSHAAHQRVTVGGTAHVLDVATRHGVAVVLTTSICAYGDAIQRRVCREDTPPGQAQGPYGRAKQGQEALAWRFRDGGGRVCVVRPANIVGPGSGPWVHDAAQALCQGLPALVGGGRGNAALTVVDNVADFLVLAAQSPAAWGQVYNLHDGLDVTWRQYFHDLAALLGTAPPRSIPRALAYLGAVVSEPLFRHFLVHQRPPVTREALNLIAWDSRFPLDKARALGWLPRVDYATVMARIREDVHRAV